MILKPSFEDFNNIGYYLGKIIIGLGLIMLLPLVFGVLTGEANPAFDFLIGAEISLICGLILTKLCRPGKELSWMQGMIVVALSWIAAMFLGAIPLYLSGHWGSYLDSCFEAMSGFTTTGLTLVRDLDHLSLTHKLWRHLMMFAGGQGIVIIALSLFMKGASGAFKMYVGEGREEKILPNVLHTSRFIWQVSMTYLILGTLALGITGIFQGMRPFSAFFHGLCLFISAFDTGGFTLHSQSVLYYHSLAFEVITVVIMLLGAMNFRLHYYIWMGNRKELVENIETRALFISILLTLLIVLAGLNTARVYPGVQAMFRKGFYQLVSAHANTGYTTIYPAQFTGEWSHLSLAGMMIAMALSGAVCSTTGAIKMLRVGIIFKALLQDIKRIILPDKAIVIKKLHHIKDMFLQDKLARAALLITMAYLCMFLFGALMGMFLGYPFLESFFESTSAAANAGLSCGITSATMPAALKVTYMLQMWAGRLEFMAVFTLIGFLVSIFRGK